MQKSSMMGNQRQMLKDNIEKELVTKIETAKDVLTQLNKNLEFTKQNSLSAKEEIKVSADVMQDILIQRKRDLIKEVDNLHNVQARSLQDAMRSTYITMGRLQSMLTNLDSFDQSQLVELQIPKVSMSQVEPTQISVTLECDQLKEDLGEWGNVTTDGFQCCLFEKLSMESPPASFMSRPCNSAFEGRNMVPPCANKENQIVPAKITAICESCPWNSFGIENWLKGHNSRKSSVAVPSPCSENNDMDFIADAELIDYPFDPLDNQRCDDGQSGSSIVCVEEIQDIESLHSDLSAWLKPKKLAKSVPLLAPKPNDKPTMKHNEIVLSSDASSFLAPKKRSGSLIEKRTLDFPCLRMETDNWVHKKKAKSASVSSEKLSSIIANEQKLIPPAYALPNPFWLKKYQR